MTWVLGPFCTYFDKLDNKTAKQTFEKTTPNPKVLEYQQLLQNSLTRMEMLVNIQYSILHT